MARVEIELLPPDGGQAGDLDGEMKVGGVIAI
jgi:hypothetical protein